VAKLTSVKEKATKSAPKVSASVSAQIKSMPVKAESKQDSKSNVKTFVKPISFKLKEMSDEILTECREKLLVIKSDLLNRVKEARGKLDQFERGGDEADQTMRLLAEQEMLNLSDRLRSQLLEIESALARMENGNYGFCEETDEVIEVERLRAIPWTRLSIEGAEIRESMNKRYAR
jgi:DnaK suppressor protein